MNVTRTINGTPVGDDEIQDYRIANEHVVAVLYNALRRLDDSGRASPAMSFAIPENSKPSLYHPNGHD